MKVYSIRCEYLEGIFTSKEELFNAIYKNFQKQLETGECEIVLEGCFNGGYAIIFYNLENNQTFSTVFDIIEFEMNKLYDYT